MGGTRYKNSFVATNSVITTTRLLKRSPFETRFASVHPGASPNRATLFHLSTLGPSRRRPKTKSWTILKIPNMSSPSGFHLAWRTTLNCCKAKWSAILFGFRNSRSATCLPRPANLRKVTGRNWKRHLHELFLL